MTTVVPPSSRIRSLETMDDYRACISLQEATWGEGFSERVSMAVLKVSQILGGVAAGAFSENGTLDGFVFGMTGPRDGEVVHWSDMLAVRRGLRDSGLGSRLKAYQRDVLLSAGVRLMHWTFDPLQARNAHLNFMKLGIVVREYRHDMYGASDSPLHRGIGTDRFVASWYMDSERVIANMERLDGRGAPRDRTARDDRGTVDSTAALDAPVAVDPSVALDAPAALDAVARPEGEPPRPGSVHLDLDGSAVRVAIPADIGAVMAADMDLALAWRQATRRVFDHYLASGFEVNGFSRGTSVCHYLLSPCSSRRLTP